MTDTPGHYGDDNPSRLDRIEALLAQTVAITNSNARAIEALTNQTAETRDGTMTLGRLLLRIFNHIMDRLEAVEARLPSEGGNGDQN